MWLKCSKVNKFSGCFIRFVYCHLLVWCFESKNFLESDCFFFSLFIIVALVVALCSHMSESMKCSNRISIFSPLKPYKKNVITWIECQAKWIECQLWIKLVLFKSRQRKKKHKFNVENRHKNDNILSTHTRSWGRERKVATKYFEMRQVWIEYEKCKFFVNKLIEIFEIALIYIGIFASDGASKKKRMKRVEKTSKMEIHLAMTVFVFYLRVFKYLCDFTMSREDEA